MSRFRLYPSPEQEKVLLEHCAQARFVWNLAVEQTRLIGARRRWPGFAEHCRQLTEARREFDWLANGTDASPVTSVEPSLCRAVSRLQPPRRTDGCASTNMASTAVP